MKPDKSKTKDVEHLGNVLQSSHTEHRMYTDKKSEISAFVHDKSRLSSLHVIQYNPVQYESGQIKQEGNMPIERSKIVGNRNFLSTSDKLNLASKSTAPGFAEKTKSITVSCYSSDCESCQPEPNIARTQDFYGQTCMAISVTDSQTQTPLSGAGIQITRVGNTDVHVSRIQEDECSENCCWNDYVDGELWCFHKAAFDTMTTGANREVTLPIEGRGDYNVSVSKDNYNAHSRDSLVSCPETPVTPFTGAIEMSITVEDTTKNNLKKGKSISSVTSATQPSATLPPNKQYPKKHHPKTYKPQY